MKKYEIKSEMEIGTEFNHHRKWKESSLSPMCIKASV